MIEKTLKDRGSKYGSFEDNATITRMLCDVLRKAPNYRKLSTEHLEAFHMIFHKIARCVCGDPEYADNIHDIAGYAQLLEKVILDRKPVKSPLVDATTCDNCNERLPLMRFSGDKGLYCCKGCELEAEHPND
jgi:hypothetical protein